MDFTSVLMILVKQEGARAAIGELTALEAAGRRADTRLGGLARTAAGAGATLGRVGRGVTRGITMPLVGIGVAAGDMAAKFQQAMELVHTQSGASQREVDQLKGKVLDLAKTSKQGPVQLADALYRLEGAGLRGRRAMSALAAASKLAAVGNANVEDTAKTLSQAWFSGIKGAGNFKRVVAELNATVGAGDLRLQQLVDALGVGILPVARQAGLTFHDITGVLATFGDETNNVSGWTAQLATALHYLYAPSAKAEGALESIGLTGSKLGADMHKPQGLLTALRDLGGHLDNLKGGRRGLQAAQTLAEILPGGRGRVLTVLLNQVDRYQQKLQQVKGTTDKFGDAVAKTNETAAFRIANAWAKVQVALVKLGGALLPVVVPMVQKVAKFIGDLGDKFSILSPSVQKVIVIVGVLAAALGPVLVALGMMAAGLAVLLSPAALVVGALAALAAGLVYAYTHSARFRQIVNSLPRALASVVAWLRQAAAWLSGAFTAALKAAQNWTDQNRVHIQRFEQAIRNIAVVVKTVLVYAFQRLLIPILQTVLAVVKAVWPAITQIIRGALQVISGLVKVFSGVFTGNWHEIWSGITSIFRGGANIVTGVFRGLLNGLAALARGFVGIFRGIGGDLIDALVTGIKAAAKVIVGVAGWLKNAVVGAVKKAFGIASPSTVMLGIGGHIASGLIKGITGSGIFKSILGGLGGSGPDPSLKNAGHGGSARQWLLQALRITGQSTPANYAALYRQMMSESGGNPRAINLWDSNAKAGRPSKGLLQTIDSTFQSYRLPSLPNDIWNPVANAVAAIRYMLARYGHIVGTGHGYASGTTGAAKGMALVGEKGPELVRFRGGEQVYDHHDSMRMLARGLRGYAKGTPRPDKGRPRRRVDHDETAIQAAVRLLQLLRGGPFQHKGVAGQAGSYTPPAPPSAFDYLDQALAQAQLTATTADDLAALTNIRTYRAGAYGDAVAGGDPRTIAQAARDLKDAQDALTGLDNTATQLADAMKGVQDELKRQTDFAEAIKATSGFQAEKMLTDVLSGHIVGRGLAGRRFTAGTAVEVNY